MQTVEVCALWWDYIQSKPGKFKCLGTPKLPQLIRSAVQVQIYSKSTKKLISSQFKFTPFFSHGTELTLSKEQEHKILSWISPFLLLFTQRIEHILPHRHTHTHAHLQVSPSKTTVLMTSDEVNSVMGKKLVLREKKKRHEKTELIQHREPVGQKQMHELIRHLNLSNLTLTTVSYAKKKRKKDFGQDMTNACTYPAFELIWLDLSQLGLYIHLTADTRS